MADSNDHHLAAKIAASGRVATLLKMLGAAAERVHVELEDLDVEAFEAIPNATLAVDDEDRRVKEVDYGNGVTLRAVETDAKIEVREEEDDLFARDLHAV